MKLNHEVSTIAINRKDIQVLRKHVINYTWQPARSEVILGTMF